MSLKRKVLSRGASNQHKCTVSTHNPDCLLHSRRWAGAYLCQEEGQSLWLFPIYSSHAHNHSLKLTFFLISQIFSRCFLSQSSFAYFQDAQHWLSYGLQLSQYFTGAGGVCHACFQLECTAYNTYYRKCWSQPNTNYSYLVTIYFKSNSWLRTFKTTQFLVLWTHFY